MFDSVRRSGMLPRSLARFARTLVAASLFGLLLAACNTTAPPDPDPPPPPGPSLVAPAVLNGVTTANLQVRASGTWSLRVEQLGEGNPTDDVASRVSLSRAAGSGNAVVTLAVDPAGLSSDPDHRFRLLLTVGGERITRNVTFSFPDVTGYAMRRADAAGGDGLQAGLLGAEGPFEQPLDGLDIEAVTSAEGTVTLIVGLESSGRGQLSTQADARRVGAPDASALQSLSTAVGQIAGARIGSRFDEAGLVLVEVPASNVHGAAGLLRAGTGVRYVDVPVPIYPFSSDEFRHLQWNLNTVQAEQLWSVSDGAGITIAVLDNGFYPDHPDLSGNVVGQYDAGDQKPSVRAAREACGVHGTHVAGIAGAVANNGIGVAGAAPGAGLYLVDLDYETRPGCPMDSASLVRGIRHVINGGAPLAQIINMSIGTATDMGQATQDALQAARNAGIILIGAAGNTRCTNGQDTFVPVSYPAAYSQVWAVGATDRYNERACYSHIGAELFVMAPGGNGFNPGGNQDTVLSTVHDHASGTHVYGWMEGTSMAAPMVAGVVALLKGSVPGATYEGIRQALIDGATDLGSPGKDNLFGHGLVNAPASYEALTGGSEPPPPPPPPPVGNMRLSIPGYGVYALEPDGIFTLKNWPVGPVTVIVESDEDGDGTFGEPGEYRGQATLDVQFDQANVMVVYLDLR